MFEPSLFCKLYSCIAGGEIVPRDVSLDCCGGSSVSSVIYDTRTQVCCQWKNNVMVYNRSEVVRNHTQRVHVNWFYRQEREKLSYQT